MNKFQPKTPTLHYVIGILIFLGFLIIPNIIHQISLDEPVSIKNLLISTLTVVSALLIGILILIIMPKIIEKLSEVIGMPCRCYYRVNFSIEVKNKADYNPFKMFFLYIIFGIIILFLIYFIFLIFYPFLFYFLGHQLFIQ